ncbi:MAG: hypothetical protein JSS02_34985 [Planctomycetes bacterium]|nr:hypothetical protein [Planctomycetota bacterium]
MGITRKCGCRWRGGLPGPPPAGKYDLRCWTIDTAGHAQSMPRPFLKSGGNAIHSLPLIVEVA